MPWYQSSMFLKDYKCNTNSFTVRICIDLNFYFNSLVFINLLG